MLRRCVHFSLAILTLTTIVQAAGWSQTAEFGVRTHRHSFHKASVESNDCTLHYRLYFTAPADAYENPDRSHYRFRARVRFGSGKQFSSLVFANRGGGERVYERDYDTTGEGCWARETQKLLGVDVEACRGRGCVPDEFH